MKNENRNSLQYKKITEDSHFFEWRGKTTLKSLKELKLKRGEKQDFDLDLLRIKAVADMQFGKGASNFLFGKGVIKLVKSKKREKIRNVYLDGLHILSMRAKDGFFTLKKEGAKRLHKGFESSHLRVVVDEDSAEFNRKGFNVFSKFVIDCDLGIGVLDEVLIVDERDALVAFGQAVLVREEMLAFESGIAVKVREGFGD